MKNVFVAVAHYNNGGGETVVEVVAGRESPSDLLEVVKADSIGRGCTGELTQAMPGGEYVDSNQFVTYTISQITLP